VTNVAIEEWDDSGLGIEPNNLKAINSLIAYRSLRYGRHLDLILTDQHSFCGSDPTDADDVGKIYDPTFNGMFSEPAMIALDAGRAFNGGKPPAELSFGGISILNPRQDSPPRTILGSHQKKWFMDQLPTRRTFPMGRRSRSGRPTPSRRSAAATTAAPITSAAKSMISSAMRRSPDSRSCPAIVTASGHAPQARRAFVFGIRQEFRSEARSRRFQSATFPAR